MRKLITHFASANLHADFLNAQKHQKVFRRQLIGWDRILITDVRLPSWQGGKQATVEFFRDGLHLASYIRNQALEIATKLNYDWLLLMDADIVMLQAPELFPPSGFAQPLLYYDRPDHLTFPPLQSQHLLGWCSAIPYSGIRSQFSPRVSSSFLIGREVFRQFRYDERFIGHGSQDNHFYEQLIDAGIKPSFSDVVTLHIWHPKREENKSVYKRNRQVMQKLCARYFTRPA